MGHLDVILGSFLSFITILIFLLALDEIFDSSSSRRLCRPFCSSVVEPQLAYIIISGS